MPPLSGALGCIFVKGGINGALEAYVDRKCQVAGTYPGPESSMCTLYLPSPVPCLQGASLPFTELANSSSTWCHHCYWSTALRLLWFLSSATKPKCLQQKHPCILRLSHSSLKTWPSPADSFLHHCVSHKLWLQILSSICCHTAVLNPCLLVIYFILRSTQTSLPSTVLSQTFQAS